MLAFKVRLKVTEMVSNGLRGVEIMSDNGNYRPLLINLADSKHKIL